MAKIISGKFKQLRAGLKKWSKEFSHLNRVINNCSWVLALLDGLEDQRNLSTLESNFRKVVKIHMQNLLEAIRLYWKQRFTIRWVKMGDENSQNFQAMATHSFRRNKISSLRLEDGTIVSDRALKAGALWTSFKNRLGISEFEAMQFDLAALIPMIDLLVMDWIFHSQGRKLTML